MALARSWLIALVLLLAWICLPRIAGAQAIKGSIVSVGIGGTAGQQGLYRAGSWVPVLVRLENRSGKEFAGRLGVEQPDLDGDKVISLGPKFILQNSDVDGRLLWTYYWPRPDDYDLQGIKSVLVFDETGSQVVASISTPDGHAGATGIGNGEGEDYRSMRYVLGVGKPMGLASYFSAWGGTEGVRFTWVQNPNQMPDDVKGLDGVDVIVWQADTVKPSDFPPEFQLKAMLEWVKAGGHLIVSVSTQGQEFLKAGGGLLDAMPMTFTGTRELKLEALADFPGCHSFAAISRIGDEPQKPGNQSPFIQALGKLKPGARPIAGGTFGPFADAPLAVTGLCGRGAITVLTINASQPELDQNLSEHNWIEFWNLVAGWQPGIVLTAREYERTKADEPVTLPPREIHIGENEKENISHLIDVTEVTQLRIFVAVLFLGAYWLLAGPVGHLFLRYYKLVHWSWWVFGGTVIVATGVAGAIVFFLHVASYDIRHKTFVLGTVNSREVTVDGFYGVYAPSSGGVELLLPNSPGGMDYLVPLCIPTREDIKPFADPQSYQVQIDHPDTVAPVFRMTLKKMQARWTGDLPGIDGSAFYNKENDAAAHELGGDLVNNSGYDLQDVQVILYRPPPPSATHLGSSHLYNLTGLWKQGDHIALNKDIILNKLGSLSVSANPIDHYLQIVGWKFASESYTHGLLEDSPATVEPDLSLFHSVDSDDLLYFLLDARTPDPLQTRDGNIHYEPVRGLARLTDSTKALYASGALIIARAGEIDKQQFVCNPIAMTVNGRDVAGKGEILFAWALPVSGDAPAALPEPPPPALEPLQAAPRGNRPTGVRRIGIPGRP